MDNKQLELLLMIAVEITQYIPICKLLLKNQGWPDMPFDLFGYFGLESVIEGIDLKSNRDYELSYNK